MKEVVIYIKGYCPYCTKAVELLRSKGIEFTIIDAQEKVEAFEKIKEQTGSRTVPQILIDGHFIGGCDDLYALEAANQLDSKLGI